MKRVLGFTCILLSISHFSIAQEKYTLSGHVFDTETNETMIGANILIPKFKMGTTTNEYGFYSIQVPKGEHQIQVSYLGYETQSRALSLSSNTRLDFRLEEKSETLNTVVIGQNTERLKINKPQMGINTLKASSIKKLPVVFGESDVIKSIVLLPGVTNAGEGSSGFNVRGGSADQNLILLDEASIFNTAHLFGFFSVFNPDVIKDLKIYKGGIPARYGGRVSSVLDIYQKEGNKKSFQVQGGIGLVASRLLIEGPFSRKPSEAFSGSESNIGKGSFLFAGRSSYAHLFLPLFDIDNKASFYDLNMKLSYRINDKNSLYLSGYFGRDIFKISDTFKNTYGNSVLNLRWNHLFSDRIFSNFSLIYSDYYYGLNLNFIEFDWNSGIKNLNLKYDFKHYLSDKIKLQYGLNSTFYHFNPGKIVPTTNTSAINKKTLTQQYALENAAYLDVEHSFSENFKASYGMRYSYFLRLGQDRLNLYENDLPVVFNHIFQIYESATPREVNSYKRSEVIKSFAYLEPRLSVVQLLNERTSLKLSYNKMTQYLHLISNTSSPTPLDIWSPSGKYIKPQRLDQYSIGFFKTTNNSVFSIELEAFYKSIKNRIDYIDGADLIANDAIEQVILNGKARAYGLEVLIKKDMGKFRGWLAYTLSRSMQKVAPRTTNESGINNGKWYNTPYDKTHDFSLVSNFKLNTTWEFNANLIFQTGQPTTYPIAQYEYQDLIVPNFSHRNEHRLPSYHRLDLSATYTPKNQNDKKWKGYWVFSIYNIYNRKNAASISFRHNHETNMNEAIRLSIFGAVPSVAYNFKF